MSSSIWELTATGPHLGAPDLDQVRLALEILADPGQGVQLQAAPAWAYQTFAAADREAAVEWVRRRGDAAGVYYALNPVRPDLAERVRVPDVLSRRWFLIDVDRKKGEADKDLSATDAEHDAARRLACDVHEYLTGHKGWPGPLLVDSGNGYHLLYRLDLPNSAFVRVLLRQALRHLAERFDGERGSIGTECHDARRVAKLPGTWARRGPATVARPHRLCKLLWVPNELLCVTAEQLQALTGTPAPAANGLAPAPSVNGHNGASGNGHAPSPFELRATAAGADGYAQSAVDREAGKVLLAPGGQRNNTLNTAAYNLGQLVAGGALDRLRVEEALAEAARRAGLADDPGCGEQGIKATIRSGIEAGMAQPRGVPEKATPTPAQKATRLVDERKPKWHPGESIIYRASGVTPRKVEWLWPWRIPEGKLTTFAGQGGLGKTFALLDIAARVSQGLDWPDTKGECCEQGQVLFISGEDEPDDTLVPRLIELGADLEQVVFLKSELQDRFTLRDLDVLDEALRQAGGRVRFVAIDPPTAFLDGVDDHKNAELRQLLSPLKSWAARWRTAMVFNTHISKPQGTRVEAMMRVMGSVAWVNAVRAAHMFAKDPQDPARRLFIPMKNNLGPERKGLAYRIKVSGDLATIDWQGEVDTTADEAINRGQGEGRKVEAADLLRQLFEGKRELASKVVWDAAKEAKVSSNALKEAQKALKIRAVKRSVGDQPMWFWVWPQDVEAERPRGPESRDEELEQAEAF